MIHPIHSAAPEALKRYFDKNSTQSRRVQYYGVALVGFDAEFYPEGSVKAIADQLAEAARLAMETWRTKIGQLLQTEKLDQFEMEFFCLPFPSADEFRKAFLKAMGMAS